MVFGEISPKIRIKSVKIPVATPAPTLPNSWMASVVAREEAEILTMLFPISMALSILCMLSVMVRTRAACLLPDSARVRIRIRLAVVNAVSAEEKKADNSSKRAKTISCMVIVGLKNITSAFYKKYL